MDSLPISAVAVAAPAAVVASGNGSAVDLELFVGRVSVVLQAALASAGTSPTLDCKIQQSITGSSGWTDVTGATFTQVTDAAGAGLQHIAIDKDSVHRYIRLVDTIGGTSSPSFLRSASLFGFLKNN